MLVGTSEPERFGLARQRLTRILAPQTMETPIYFHMTEGQSREFRQTVDQLAEVGFDMIFYSFGSGFDLQTTVYNMTILKQLKDDIAYANARGIEGFYSFLTIMIFYDVLNVINFAVFDIYIYCRRCQKLERTTLFAGQGL